MNIFLDLDGPILDNSHRLYKLYSDLVRRLGKQPLAKQSYWRLKRNCIKESEILTKSSGMNFDLIQRYWRAREKYIESRQYLRLNRLITGSFNALKFLTDQGKLFLVTTRQSEKNLIWELKQKGIIHFFADVLCGFDKKIAVWEVKARLIRQAAINYQKGVIIGDTEAEIICGKNLGLFTIAVANGIRSKSQLRRLEPDIICSHIGRVRQKWQFI